MSFSKLRKMHVIIIGSVLLVGAIAAIVMLMVKPQQQAYQAALQRRDAAQVLGCRDAQSKAELARNSAFMEKAKAQQELDLQMERRMPKLNFSRRETAMIALWHEQIENLGPLLENFARDRDDRNVQVLGASFAVQAPPVNPNDAVFTQQLLTFDLGAVTARGDFKSLMNNIRRWNNCNRLVLLTPPQLGGVSPQLTVTYGVRCYVYPVATAGANSLVQIAGGSTAGAPGSAAPAAPAAPAAMPTPAMGAPTVQ